MSKEIEPLVSVVIPCYNHEKYIQDSIQSVIDQTYPNIELIIIDDGSSDASVSKIEAMSKLCEDRFVRFEFRARANKGLSATLNEAIEWCRGDFFSGLASDDVMLPDKTEYQVRYLRRAPECIGIFGSIQLVNSHDRQLFRSSGKAGHYQFQDIILRQHSLPAATQMVRLGAIREVGGFREDILIEDWYMWLMLTKNGGTLHNCGRVLARYRRHDGNISKNIDAMRDDRFKILGLFKDHALYSRAMASVCFSSAADLQLHSKRQSLKWILWGLRWNRRQVLQRSMAKYVVKLFVPKKLLIRYYEG